MGFGWIITMTTSLNLEQLNIKLNLLEIGFHKTWIYSNPSQSWIVDEVKVCYLRFVWSRPLHYPFKCVPPFLKGRDIHTHCTRAPEKYAHKSSVQILCSSYYPRGWEAFATSVNSPPRTVSRTVTSGHSVAIERSFPFFRAPNRCNCPSYASSHLWL